MQAESKPLMYEERVTSASTEVLFIILALTFGALSAWRVNLWGFDWLAIVCLFFGLVFLFYSLNYRVLVIRITGQAVVLKFGIISWSVPFCNIAGCQKDNPPALTRLGGAGIHFYSHTGRYRASFNFLEYPRVVVQLKHKRGRVQEISFTTRQPDEVIRQIQAALLSR